MEIKLPIYEKKEVIKTYTAETYDISFGAVEDLLDVLDMDKLTSGNKDDLVSGVMGAIPGVFSQVKPILKEIFDGLTDEEIRKCHMSDIVSALVKIIKFSMSQIMKDVNSKN